VYVLHDEIYRELCYTDDAGEFGKIYPHTIVVNSLSKSNALTGLRIGWVMAPANVMPAIVKMHGWATSCANTFSQRVAFEIFSRGELGAQRPWYARQRAAVLDAVRETPLAYVEPQGAFYLCVRVGGDTLAFAEALIEERDVIAVPGDVFSADLAGWMRTSFVGPVERIREGLHRIANLAAERGTLAARGRAPSRLG
jgi:aminotransferase